MIGPVRGSRAGTQGDDEDDETNSNFGFNLPWWDRLLGTYRAQPRGGHERMTHGIRTYRDPRLCAWLPGILVLPFLGKVSEYAINRRQWANKVLTHRGRRLGRVTALRIPPGLVHRRGGRLNLG